MKAKILLGEDDEGIRFGLRKFLVHHDYAVCEEETCAGILSRLGQDSSLDLAILDDRLPDGRALELLPKIHEMRPDLPVILLTGHGSIDLAVEAIKLGAEHFLTKPVKLDALLVIVDRLAKSLRTRRRQRAERSTENGAADPFLGTSAAIRKLHDQATKAAAADLPLLLLGETGTGKGVLAQWIHRHSDRRKEGFVDVNCAGLRRDFLESELFGHEKGAFTGADRRKEGLFEVADRGTLFLDEVGDMSIDVQRKLLKALEEKRFRRLGATSDRCADVRIVAATHRHLTQMARAGEFRKDLFYRISSVSLVLPPLRERREDIPHLARHLLVSVGRAMGKPDARLDPACMDPLRAHDWPGNIRELKNVLERALLFAADQTLGVDDLDLGRPMVESSSWDSHLTLQELEEQHVRRVLEEEGGRIAKAARRLGIHRSTLYEKVKRYDIELS